MRYGIEYTQLGDYTDQGVMYAPTAIASDERACPVFSRGFWTVAFGCGRGGAVVKCCVFVRVSEYEWPNPLIDITQDAAVASSGRWRYIEGS